ncbi:hypothetical protein GLOIN_2v1571020 [Rhizophagus irregularis DAOM 181602=DAOM 197198]|nr:hypothetical protein GLOIN_2v1571020 [Rhizophagus irregularis DAOM 181602=DAOM 197198]
MRKIKQVLEIVADTYEVSFGLKADSYDQLPCIEIGNLVTPEEIRNSVIEEFLRMHKASPPITSYEVSGSHGKRPIDWVIKMGDTIISVTGKENDNNATMITRRKDRLYLTTAEVKGRIYFE